MLPSFLLPGAEAPRTAILALADGTLFTGDAIGAEGHCAAHIVFNTAMTGHQEIITDPAYYQKILVFTFPHIGSTGVNPEDDESGLAQVGGLVVRDCPSRVSNFRATQSLPEYLKAQGVVAISGVDTRQLTRHLRDQYSTGACILVGDDAERAVALAREAAAKAGQSSAPNPALTTKPWLEGRWQLGQGYAVTSAQGPHLAVVDLGVKRSLLRALADTGCQVTVVAPTATWEAIQASGAQGVVLSSGAGAAAQHTEAVELCRHLLAQEVPVLGVGLGSQVLALAADASLERLAVGRHGLNHAVKVLATNRVAITTQNYCRAIDPGRLPAAMQVTHTSLFDGSIQGFTLADKPAIGVQAIMDGGPGPHDLIPVFSQFLDLLAAKQ